MRPLGLEGVDGATIPVPAVLQLATCRSEVARSPDSARARFELGRLLYISSQCPEAASVLEQAGAMGSAAAYFLLGFGTAPCTDRKQDLTLLNKAASMGSGVAAETLSEYYWDKIKDLDSSVKMTGVDADNENNWKKYTYLAANNYEHRAEAGDMYAIFRMAVMSHSGGTMVSPSWVNWVYKCVVRGYAPCQQYDSFR